METTDDLLLLRLKDLAKSIQESSEMLYGFSESKLYNPKPWLAKAILDDLAKEYEELGGLLRGISQKEKELFGERKGNDCS